MRAVEKFDPERGFRFQRMRRGGYGKQSSELFSIKREQYDYLFT